jgi:Gas vesicle synthesis protein GvpL/GvpF
MRESQARVYVYGVLPASEQTQVSVPGVAGSQVTTVEYGGLTALTSRLPDADLTASDVRAHWAVLEQAFEHATVLPMRFGTAVEGDEAVRDRLLEPNAEQLGGLLGEMAGLGQLTVKGTYDEPRLLEQIVVSSPPIAALRDRLRSMPEGVEAQAERMRLGQLVGDEVAHRRHQHMTVALDMLRPLAVDTRSEQAAHPVAFKLAFLVARNRREAFDEGVTTLRDTFGQLMTIRYVGPLPPYSFAEAKLSTGDAAWA